MTESEQIWSSQDVDAVNLLVRRGTCRLEGTAGDQVQLLGEFIAPASDAPLQPAGRWLQLTQDAHIKEADFTLRLPRHRAWVVDLAGAQAEIEVRDLTARLSILLGKGSVRVADCRGHLALAGGTAQVQVTHWAEAEAPERPAQPEGAYVQPPFTLEWKLQPRGPWDWQAWRMPDWEDWALRFGEQMLAWTHRFHHFFGRAGLDELAQSGSLGLHLGKGEAHLTDVQTEAATLRMGKGNAELRGGRIANLEVELGRGDLHSLGTMPTGEWEVEVRHGDIRLVLPAGAAVRLDAATRHGDIHSNVPLVRVGRPGPEARHSRRMVGSLGGAEEGVSGVNLATGYGDIWIEAAASGPARPQPERVSQPSAPPGAPAPSVERPAADRWTQLAVLEALQAGQISLEEADQLLQSLEA